MSASNVDAAIRFDRPHPGPLGNSSLEPFPESGIRAPRRPLAARLLLLFFRGYQFLRVGRVSPCRFTPTCSAYAIEAVERHGAARGAGLAVRRLGRCRPGGPSGYDPVPE